MFGNLLKYNYEKVYKRTLMDFGLIYVELQNVRFKNPIESKLPIKYDLCIYLKLILERLHDEYLISVENYKLSKDKSVFKSNFYLLGIEIKSYKVYIESNYLTSFDSSDEFDVFLLYILNRLDTIILSIEKEVLKWCS